MVVVEKKMNQKNIKELEDYNVKNDTGEKKRKPYVKPALTIHGDLDVITQNLAINPCDGCCGRS